MLYLALRHLLARRKQTLFTLLGVFFASSAFVVITGFFLGFQEYLIDQLVNNDAHIRISFREEILAETSLNANFFGEAKHVFWASPPGGKKSYTMILDPQGWFIRLRQDPRVEAFAPQLTSQVIFSRANTTVSGRLIGTEVAKQELVTSIANYMVQGKFSDIGLGGSRLIMGDELLGKLGARVGESILVSNGKNGSFPFKIVGSFHIGIRTLDESVGYAAIQDVQNINHTPSQVNEIAVRLKDVERAREVASNWKALSPERVQSWDQINANVLNVFQIQNAVRYLVTFVIVLVAGFGVYNILNMVVTQKRKDIAILRSMGFDQGEVVYLFLSQGLIVGVIGGLLGAFVGHLICLYLETIPFGGGPLGSAAGHMTISFKATNYIYGILVSLVSAGIASYLPARSAGKLTPIEIIRAGTD